MSGSGSASHHDAPKGEVKGSQNTKVAPRRRSSEVQKLVHQGKLEEKATGNKSKDRVVSASATKVMQQKVAKNSAYSSDDEMPQKAPAQPKKTVPEAGKKRQVVQGSRQKNVVGSVPPSTGGKAPPSVLKQHQQSMGTLSKVVSGSKAIAAGVKSTTQAPKTSEKHGSQSKVKKKSIFSPDNSSDTDDGATTKNTRQPAKNKQNAKVTQQKSGKSAPAPPKTRKMSSKSSAESSATTTTTTDDSSESESETVSSEDSSPPAKKMAIKKSTPKAANSTAKPSEEPGKNNAHTDSEHEASNKPTGRTCHKFIFFVLKNLIFF